MTRRTFAADVNRPLLASRARRYLLIALISLVAPVSARAQTLTPADTAAVVQALLKEYRASHGPVVRVSEFLSCGDPESWTPERLDEIQPCFSQAAASVLRAYAAQTGIEVVDSYVPVCSWNPEDKPTKGVQLEVLAPAYVGDEVRAGLLARCMAGRGGFGGAFVEGNVYVLERVDGVWCIVRRVASFAR